MGDQEYSREFLLSKSESELLTIARRAAYRRKSKAAFRRTRPRAIWHVNGVIFLTKELAMGYCRKHPGIGTPSRLSL